MQSDFDEKRKEITREDDVKKYHNYVLENNQIPMYLSFIDKYDKYSENYSVVDPEEEFINMLGEKTNIIIEAIRYNKKLFIRSIFSRRKNKTYEICPLEFAIKEKKLEIAYYLLDFVRLKKKYEISNYDENPSFYESLKIKNAKFYNKKNIRLNRGTELNIADILFLRMADFSTVTETLRSIENSLINHKDEKLFIGESCDICGNELEILVYYGCKHASCLNCFIKMFCSNTSIQDYSCHMCKKHLSQNTFTLSMDKVKLDKDDFIEESPDLIYE